MRDVPVVVTGMGCVSSIGIGVSAFWSGLLAGRSGIKPVSSFDVSDYRRKLGAEVTDFDPAAHLLPEQVAGFGRASHFALAAIRMALVDAGFDQGGFAPSSSTAGRASPRAPARTLLALGTALGELVELERMDDAWHAGGPSAIDAGAVRRQLPSSMTARIAFGLALEEAQVVQISSACTSSNVALAHAFDAIRAGSAPLAIVGGTDVFSRGCFASFVRLGAVAPERCQPFDRDRKGIMIGEGAGILVLESLASAQRRGARPHAEILGYGLACDADHIAAPEGKGAIMAMRAALAMARVSPSEIDYVGAHGTGTLANDRTEARAILEVFGDHGSRVPVSSIKAMIGHTNGAANVHHAIAAIMASRDGRVPPTINFETADPECPLDCVPNHAREVKVRTSLVNGAGFGGNNACVIFRGLA